MTTWAGACDYFAPTYLLPREVPPPERWVGLPGVGKGPANRAARARLLGDGAAVYLHDWSCDYSDTYQAGCGVRLDPTAGAQIDAAARASAERVRAERRAREHRAILRARTAWAAATPATAHLYWCVKFGPDAVLPPGLRVDRDGWLLVPRRDVSGRLVGLQRIGPDGAKRYSAGTPARGTFCGLGTVDPDGTVLVAEGLATGATVHAETGHPCAVAFDAGNLEPVATLLRERYPAVRIVLCADDDRQTVGNPGRTKAEAAARIVGAAVAVPPLCRCCRCSDFNDAMLCARRRGLA